MPRWRSKLYDRKTPITAAEILNDRVVPFYDEHGIRLSRMLTDRGTEFCGNDLPPEEWTPGYADFASACSGVM
jgi:hypothetical protein